MAKAIRLYGVVGQWWDDMDAKSVTNALIEAGDEDVDIYISSYGGDLADGMAIYNALRRYRGETTAYIDAVAASSATVIMLGADRVVMPKSSMIMIHNPWNLSAGDYRDMAKAAEVLEKHRDAIVSIYQEKTGKDVETLQAMLDDETWMTAEEALAEGFIDEVIDAREEEVEARALACIDFEKFNKAPERLAKVAAMYRSKQRAPSAPKGETPMEEKKTPQRPDGADVEKMKAEAKAAGIAEAKAHLAAVTELCERVGIKDEAIAIASETETVAEAQARVIDIVAKRNQTPTFTATASVQVGTDSRDKFKAAAVDAIQMRGAVKRHDTQNQYRHMSMLRMMEECVVQAGGTPARDRETLMKQAFNVQGYGSHTTSDFPEITRDSINKSVLRGFEESAETWDQIAVPGSLGDFKTGHMVGLNVFDDLDAVSEGGEYKYGTIQERGEEIQLGTYGKLLKITREMIINDDAGIFTRVPEKMGRAAARVPGNLVYNVLINNGNLKDGNALFSTANGNTFAAVLDYDGLDALNVAMTTQAFDGKTLGIRPQKLVVPPQLELTARQLMLSELADSENQANVFRNRFDVVVEHRLSGDAAQWYLLADPALFDTIMVAFLDGNQQPFVDEKEGWDTDSIQYKIRLDCAAAAMESKTMARGGDGS